MFADKRLERNIMALKVKCRNSHKECEWTGELADLVKVVLYFVAYE